jgi:hypothetical protein
MTTADRIDEYLASQPEPKRTEMRELHRMVLDVMPSCQLWFLDGTNDEGKVVSNPNIGYGSQTMTYADGKTREFYRIGLSGNKAGISVYVMGLDDKAYLARTYGKRLGKAKVTGYCIRFASLGDIDRDALTDAIRHGLAA